MRVDFGTDNKLSQVILKAATKVHKASYILFSATDDGNRFGVYSTTTGDRDAVAWVSAAVTPAGDCKASPTPCPLLLSLSSTLPRSGPHPAPALVHLMCFLLSMDTLRVKFRSLELTKVYP